MPPICNKNSRNSIEQEGKILLAISALKNEEIRSIREAARIFQVPYTTLIRRYHGVKMRAEKIANGLKLSTYEEESLIKWILDLAKRGLPPRPSLVRYMANHLLSQRGSRHATQQVSEKWVYRLVNRRPGAQITILTEI
jgi:hypothetical protein